MIIGTYRHFKDNKPTPVETDWAGFCAKVIGAEHVHFPGDKLKTPAFTPAEYKAGLWKRDNANVNQLWLAVLDYDGISIQRLQEIEKQCEGNRFLAYTSYSHVRGPTARIRLVFDLDRPVSVAEWPDFWAKLAAALPDPSLDQACKDPSRLYGLPYTPNPHDAMIAVAEGYPLCVDEVLGGEAGSAPVRPDQERSQTVTHEELERYAKRLERKADVKQSQMGRWLLQVATKEPFAVKDTRHNTGLEIAMHLERVFPLVPIDDLAALFEGSFSSMGARDEQAELLQDITNSLQGARDKRLISADSWQKDLEEKEKQQMRNAFGNGRTEPYSEEELKAFAKEAGTTVAGFQSRWIIAHQGANFAFVDGDYCNAVTEKDLLMHARDALAPAKTAGVELRKMNKQGEWVNKSRDEILRDYGTAAEHVVASFTAPRSRYDASTWTFTEAICPPRPIVPERSEAVEKWLELLGGKRYEDLLLWIKLCFDLNDPLCALYLEGVKGSGKSLFAAGMSRIWGEYGPTSATAATADFNNAITQNPLVFADEFLPPAWNRRVQGFDHFREFVAAKQRDLNRKFLPRVPLMGCVRVIIAANNNKLIRGHDSLTKNDREAIIERICHISAGRAASTYLEQLGIARVRAFVAGDELAKHAAWVRDNLAAERQGRFGLLGKNSGMHTEMQQSQPENAAVAEWIIGFLLDPERFWGANPIKGKQWALVREGKVLLNSKALKHTDNWKIYVSSPDKPPSAYKLSRSLADLCDEEGYVQIKGNFFRVYDRDRLIAMATSADSAAVEEIDKALANAK